MKPGRANNMLFGKDDRIEILVFKKVKWPSRTQKRWAAVATAQGKDQRVISRSGRFTCLITAAPSRLN